MRKFDYTFLKKEIPGNLVGLTAVIADLNAKETIRRIQYEDTFEALKKKAIIESVRESNAIEGIVTSEERFKDIMAGSVPLTHSEYEISGYKDALNLIHTEHEHLNFDESLILLLHRMIMADTDSDRAGKYKTSDNVIIETGKDGRRRVRFRPTAAAKTQDAMEQLILAYLDARQDAEIPALFLIPCVILDFLCIHPFTDGNGRVSRLLSVLLLYYAGFDIAGFISLEGQIGRYKENYYEALEASSKDWETNGNDYMPFAVYFLQILYRCFKEMDESFTALSLKKSKKSERVEAVILSSIIPLSKADIADKLVDVSIKTIEAVLGKLVKEGKIKKIGTYRDARYVTEK